MSRRRLLPLKVADKDNEKPSCSKCFLPKKYTKTIFKNYEPDVLPSFDVHPLLFPDVAVEIFSYLKLPDLKSCKSVCKLWSLESSSFVARGSCIHLRNLDDLNNFMLVANANSTQRDRDRFTNFRLGQNLSLQQPLTNKFFNRFGGSIKYLYLDKTHWIPASLRKILFEKLPNLEELIIHSQRVFENNLHLLPLVSSANDAKNVSEMKLNQLRILRIGISDLQSTEPPNEPSFMNDLISASPNLELITGLPKEPELQNSKIDCLRYTHQDNYLDQCSLDEPDLQVILGRILLDLDDYPSSIKNFKTIFNTSLLPVIRNKNFLLEKLHVVIPGKSFTTFYPRPTIVHSFITHYKQTLNSLKLEYCAGQPKLLTPFEGICRLTYLKHLCLHRVNGTLDFLNSLPRLKTLYMTQEDFIMHYDEFHISEGKYHSLETLKLYYTSWSASSVHAELPRPPKMLNVVQNIVQRFPKLKSFRMETLTDKCLYLIYQNLKDLEELEVTNGIFTLSGLCGIAILEERHLFMPFRPDGREPKNPPIYTLKNLRKLRLESHKVTDSGILNSLPKIETLRELTLLCYKVTDDTLKCIISDLELDYLKTEFCYQFSPEVVHYAKQKFKERNRTAKINEFCSDLDSDEIHKFLNENGPVHIDVPDFNY